MRNSLLFVASVAALVMAGPALGQNLLKQFESKAKAPAASAPAAPAPGPGLAPATEAAAPPGNLGVFADDTPDLKGVLLTRVKKSEPAEQGGLRDGDIITAIDGKPCRNLDDLDKVLEKGTVGTKLVFTVLRMGKEEKKTITLGRKPAIEAEPGDNPGEAPAAEPPLPAPTLPGTSRPAPPSLAPATVPAATPPTLLPGDDPLGPSRPGSTPRDPALELPEPPTGDRPATEAPPAEAPAAEALGASGKASLGIQVVPLNDETRGRYRTAARQGAVIVSVRPGSAADAAGLPIGGVVVSIDGQLVKTSDDLVEAINAARPGQEVELRYYQGDRLSTKAVRLAPAAARGAVPSSPPPRPGLSLAPTDRPLLRRFEDMVESLGPETPPRTTVGSTIIDPSVLAEMHKDIKAMKEQLDGLETRVKALEGKANP